MLHVYRIETRIRNVCAPRIAREYAPFTASTARLNIEGHYSKNPAKQIKIEK